MELKTIGTLAVIGGGIASAVSYIIGKIVSKVRHESGQDNTVKYIVKDIEDLKEDIKILKNSNKDYEVAMASIIEKIEALNQGHETTQSMIGKLTDNQQETFTKLLETIKELSKINKEG